MRLCSEQIIATTGWITVASNHLVVGENKPRHDASAVLMPSNCGKQVSFTKTVG
jgi:hypothetical protein